MLLKKSKCKCKIVEFFPGHGNMVRFLVENGANVNNEASVYKTPLICAIKKGEPVSQLEFLLWVCSANVQALPQWKFQLWLVYRFEYVKNSKIFDVILNGLGDADLVQFLIEHGADTSNVTRIKLQEGVWKNFGILIHIRVFAMTNISIFDND